jgi:tetratricopeptide (TPR) repeat protein
MKATNLKLPKLRLWLQQEERKLNNIVRHVYRKAGFLACLFLCFISSLSAQEWAFNENTQQAYDLVLNFQTQEALALIPDPKTAQEHYVTSLAEALELLITEDAIRYPEYEDHFEALLDRKTKLNSPHDLFLQSEIALHWSFVHLKYGHEFDAALNLRQAYHTAQEIRKRFPKYTAINKTSGLMQIVIGSIPEKYNWILGMMNIEGSTENGIKELEEIRKSDHALAFESDLLYAVVQGFILQHPEVGIHTVRELLTEKPNNKLALFIGASLAIKNAQSEEALNFITTLQAQHSEEPIYYADYLKGEVYLQKGDYINAISSFRWFITHYDGQNYLKDAHYKMGLCYWLNGNVNDALLMFKKAKTVGKAATEADRYAESSITQPDLPNIKLTKIRYAIDGGYFEDASNLLASVRADELITKRDKVEYFYRKARLAHKTGDLSNAQQLYLQTAISAEGEPWYFAPNAYL